MRILVTGGCGFIGSNFIRHTLASHPQDQIINLDALTYAGNPENLADVQADYPDRYQFVLGNVCDQAKALEAVERADAVLHFAAESHVDRSIEDPSAFMTTNVVGTNNLLMAALKVWGAESPNRFVYVSTDEVYGALRLEDDRAFREDWPLSPKSPYSASKAAGDHLAQAFHHTYGLNVSITRCSNNYGPFQFPEKLAPLVILNAAAGKPLPVYGDGLYVRDWIFVTDNCRATDLVLRKGRAGAAYNIGAENEKPNLEVVKLLADLVAQAQGKPAGSLHGLISHVKDRPGHDRRYAINAGRLREELGFAPDLTFDQGMAATVDWYLGHGQWCERVTTGAYQDYYRRMYEGR